MSTGRWTDAAYILPIRSAGTDGLDELTEYLRWLADQVELIVVDGSPSAVFEQHSKTWQGFQVVLPAEEFRVANGKVQGVLTGLSLTKMPKVVIADDDVRYGDEGLRAVLNLLDTYDVVRPQNYFQPMPWHAKWDTARSLLNRVFGGDWPGTLAVRRDVLIATGGYDGDCLFENLELVRTVKAAGGREFVAGDVFVRRLPPTSSHFFSQRVRQAYDEFARPWRLAAQLTWLPIALLLMARSPRTLLLLALFATVTAEAGRRCEHGSAVFPLSASLMAPFWLLERAVCAWLAVMFRLKKGGIPYAGGVLKKAASSPADLHKELGGKPIAGAR